MRTLLRLTLDTEAGNRAILDGSLPMTIGQFVEQTKPEAAYFGSHNGKRSALSVFAIADAPRIPVIAEPSCIALAAEIEMTPVMNLDDMQKGIAAAATAR